MTDYRMLAEVEDYKQAQFLVDGLSDAGFPVEHTRIIGTELETVEDVRGRRTVASRLVKVRSAAFGLASSSGSCFLFWLRGSGF